MSEVSTLVKKWEAEIKAWVAKEEPVVEAEFESLASQFKTAVGPAILKAAEDAIPILVEAGTGVISGSTTITALEGIGKNLLTAIESVAKSLATQGIQATGTQIIGALATQLAVNTATPAAPVTGAGPEAQATGVA
jgi:hypothetical protein